MIVPEPDQNLWYKVISIPKYHVFHGIRMNFTSQAEKQFMTRVLYSGATPFKTTFHADSTLFFCDSEAPREILNNMKNSDVDFAIGSRTIREFFPSSWATLYNWNSRTKLLLRDWVFEMLNDGITIIDDQAQIQRALVKAVQQNRITARRLSSNWAYTPLCYYGDGTRRNNPCNLRVSIPVNGRIRMTHAINSEYCKVNGINNSLINTTRAYSLVMKPRSNVTIVFSQDELNKLIQPYRIPPMDWTMKTKSSISIFWEECTVQEPICGYS